VKIDCKANWELLIPPYEDEEGHTFEVSALMDSDIEEYFESTIDSTGLVKLQK
jgi:hypothetical protein